MESVKSSIFISFICSKYHQLIELAPVKISHLYLEVFLVYLYEHHQLFAESI